ncbi:MAG TPA: PAS domain S-box protein [Ktedonobacteraceae bacterium]|nr:PAS domain S-box protein [Ktedonobacteraceae bacterium]
MNSLYPADKQEKPDEHAAQPPERPEDRASISDIQPRTTPQHLWGRTLEFFTRNTFVPTWLPRRWSHPLIGYLVATLLQVASVTVDVLLLQVFPSFHFPEALILLVVVGIAITWGVGPSVIATLVGALLLAFLILPPYFSLAVAEENVVGMCLYLFVGLTVSVLVGQRERVRRAAEEANRRRDIALQAEAARAGELQVVFDAMVESEARFRLLAENAQDVIYRFHFAPTFGYDYVSPAVTTITGYSPEEYYTDPELALKIVHPDDRPRLQAQRQGTEPLGDSLTLRWIRKDGTIVWIEQRNKPIYDEAGTVVALEGIARDITERVRLETAEREATREAAERASQMEAIFEAVTDQIMVYDRDGRLIRLNDAGRQFNKEATQVGYSDRAITERVSQYRVRDEQDHILAAGQWPIIRVLQGEVLTSANAEDVRLTLPNGREVQLSTTGAPIRDAQGQIVGAVLVNREVTERRELEQRTRTALEALLAMAQAVVQGQDEDQQEADETSRHLSSPLQPAPVIARQLAELTRHVLGCQRLGIQTVEPETELLRPLAVTGLSPEQERQWWLEQLQQEVHLSDGADPALLKRLLAGEVLQLDLTQPPYQDLPNPYHIRQMLIAPMLLGNQLVGLLSLDYGGLDHTYTKEEIDLTAAVARLVTLVIERERLLRERTEAEAQTLALQEANRRMTDFLSIAGHEIRTPLTTMKGNIQLAKRSLTKLLRQEATPPQQVHEVLTNVQSFLDRADRQANVQSRLVRDLLDVSRIEADRLELHSQRCDLVAIARQAIEDQRSVTPGRSIQFVITPPKVFVQADPDRIGQVISNYLSNALKYSQPSSPVEVCLELEEPGNVRLSVRDEGPGLTATEQQHIWERFYRALEIAVQSGSGVGLGLGLYICRIIIERQGGQVGVESKKGIGSTFWFTLPLHSPIH